MTPPRPPPANPAAPPFVPATTAAERFGWLAIVALALALRLWRLPVHEPWLDEACSLLQAGKPALDAILGPFAASTTAAAASPHPPLYFLLLKGAVALLGDGIFAARVVSVAAGIVLVLATGVAGRALAGRSGGLFAALIAALSPLAIHYSVEVRGYILLAGCAMVFALALARFVSAGGRRPATVMAIALIAATMTHFYGLLLTPLPLLLVAVHRDEPARRQRAVRGCWLAVAAATPALMLTVATVTRGLGGVDWLQPPASLAGAAWQSFSAVLLGTTIPSHLRDVGFVSLPLWSRAIGGVLGVGGLGMALTAAWRSGGGAEGEPDSGPQSDDERIHRATLTWTLLGMAALAIGLPLVASLWRPLALPGRYELAAMPALQALIGAGLALAVSRVGTRLARPGAATTLALMALLALGSLHLTAWAALDTLQPYRVLAGKIAAATQTSTGPSAVVHTDLTLPPLRWHLDAVPWPAGTAPETLTFPTALAQHPCWQSAPAKDLAKDAAAWVAARATGAAPAQLLVVVRLDNDRPRPTGLALLRALAQGGWRQGDGGTVGDYALVSWLAPGQRRAQAQQ